MSFREEINLTKINDASLVQKKINNEIRLNKNNAKHDLRILLLKKRKSLKKKFLEEYSNKITTNLLDFTPFINAQKIGLYYPILNEVDTLQLYIHSLGLQKELYFPRVESSVLKFHRVLSLDNLVIGSYKIPEPDKSCESVNNEELDLFLIPGVSFDLYGGRIGYGKGYYDRTIKNISHNKLCGLAYQFQIVENIPIEESDVDVGYIATEIGIISSKRRVEV